MRNRYLLGAGVAFAVALSWADAQAQLLPMPTGPGAWYFGGGGGWTSLESPQTGTLGGASFRQRFSDGYSIGARVGYEWGPLRFEEEFRFQQNGIAGVGAGAVNVAATGNRNAYAFMTNAIYDFTFGWPITPHLGVGVGVVQLHDAMGVRGVGTLSRSTDTEFGYQGIAGVRYNINPSLAFDVDYRYLATSNANFRGTALLGGLGYSSGYATHSVLANLSVRFGAAPAVAAPPVPAAPMAAARKVFLVFFDWDRDTVTAEGLQIVQQAAAAFKAGGPVTIQVTGYTDRSGSPGYNQRLSERRANNVANALTKLGVPRNQMAISGRGENDNRVPTAPGVREPQNRRVEIVFP